MKTYTKPVLELLTVSAEDIIVTSGFAGEDDPLIGGEDEEA